MQRCDWSMWSHRLNYRQKSIQRRIVIALGAVTNYNYTPLNVNSSYDINLNGMDRHNDAEGHLKVIPGRSTKRSRLCLSRLG